MRSWYAALGLVALVVGCGGRSERTSESKEAPASSARPAAAHSDEPEHEALTKKIQLSNEVIEAAKIKTEAAVRGLLVKTIALPGELAADPDKSARVASPVAGRLTAVHFQEGTNVKKGDVLATVRVPDVAKVRAAYASVAAKAEVARANASRVQSLADKGLAATQETLSTKAEAESLDAEARALGEQVRMLGLGTAPGGGSELTLRAPIAGVVLTRNAVVGQPITGDEVIASIANLSNVWFLGRVFEKDLELIKVGAVAEVELNAYNKQRFAGTVEYLSRQIDLVARTISARIRLENKNDLLRVGLFGTAHVSLGENEAREPSLLVPRSAVVEIGKKPVVFVRHPDGDFELHQITLGNSAFGRAEVVAGLREGEQVVVDGAFSLKSIALKGEFAEEE